MNPQPFRVIPCAEWKARPPRSPVQMVSAKPVRSIFHHTAGHVPNSAKGETYEEACAYARAIQRAHTTPSPSDSSKPWIDSGHNFLITRGGFILEGRHGSLAQVRRGKMVVSAHCPTQNTQPGVEIEHNGSESMTPIQYDAAVWLFAWIARSCAFPGKAIDGHCDHYNTACPGALYAQLPQFRKDVSAALAPKPIPKPRPKVSGYWLVTKTFYDGHEAPPEKVGSLRLWHLRQGNIHKKGVVAVREQWVETG